jgi:hypothetical protein
LSSGHKNRFHKPFPRFNVLSIFILINLKDAGNGVNPVFLDWKLGIFLSEKECLGLLRGHLFLKLIPWE